MKADLPEVASLWIGERLSPLELLCLKSFSDAGHKVTLYTYGELVNPPVFCEIRDAREIWDHPEILIHEARKSPAIHSDIWRIKLMLKSDAIWIDTDAYCIRPFTTTDGYLVGVQDRRGVNTGVLRLPQDSQALLEFDEFLTTLGSIPPWWSAQQTEEFIQDHDRVDFRDMKWGTTGPLGLTYFMRKSGEFSKSLPRHVLYPLPQSQKRTPLLEKSVAQSFIKSDTLSAHFYAAGFRRIMEGRGIRPESYLGDLFRRHNLPLPKSVSSAHVFAPKRADRRWKRRNQRVAQSLIVDMLSKARGRAGGRLRCVQVGANDGRLADPLYSFFAADQIEGLLIEPSPDYFAALENTHADHDHIALENVGIANQAGELTLHQLAKAFQNDFPRWAQGCASMIREQLVSVLETVRPVTDEMISSVTVPVTRLDTLLRKHRLMDAELLVIDVEGFEANVFQSFEFEGFLPHAIIFEFTHMAEDDAAEIHRKLATAGYRTWIMVADVIAIHEYWLPPSIQQVFALLSIEEWTAADVES